MIWFQKHIQNSVKQLRGNFLGKSETISPKISILDV